MNMVNIMMDYDRIIIFFPRKEDISVFSSISQASIYSMSQLGVLLMWVVVKIEI